VTPPAFLRVRIHLADPEALARRLSREEAAEGPTAAW
jgi:hypothetical protein